MHTYWTSMLWSSDSCQKQGIHWSVSLTRIAGSGVEPSKSSIFWSYPLTSYYFSNDRRLKFIFQFIWNMLCLCAAQLRFWFQTDLERENSATYYRQGRQLLLVLLTMVTRWARSTSIFLLWLVKVWQVSSCEKFMQHLESCLLWQLKLTKFCVNLWCF